MWRITWKSLLTKKMGHGSLIFKTMEECKRQCEELNREWTGELEHWPEEI
jgi:hypothetical protein